MVGVVQLRKKSWETKTFCFWAISHQNSHGKLYGCFLKMVVPPKHPKMIIFSRKTHGCWGNPPDEVGGPTCTMERCMVAGFTEGPPPRNLLEERVSTWFLQTPRFGCRGNPGFWSKQMGKCCQGKKGHFSPWILRNFHDVEL